MKNFNDFTHQLNESGLHVFDVDGVVFHPHAHVHVLDHKGNRVEKLNHHQFNTHQLQPGHKYDFSEFRNAENFHTGSPIHPIIRKIKKIQQHGGKVAFNSARADFDDKDKVLNKFEKHGIDMNKAHFHRAGNEPAEHSTGEKKNRVLRRVLDKGIHTHVHFYDDDKQNLHHFLKLKKEYPHIKFHAHHVDETGATHKYEDKQ